MELARTAIGIALALFPAAFSLIRGRRLVRLADDPALPERLAEHRRQLGGIATVCMVGAIVAVYEHAIAIGLLGLLCLCAGGFPARRRLYQEQWGLAGYLSHILRFILAMFGFWILLLWTPSVIVSSGNWNVLAAALLALVLILWSTFYTRIFLLLMRSTTLNRDDLVPGFDAVNARSKAPPPSLWRVDLSGGRWVNAVALPSLLGSAVLFSGTLLSLLDPGEVAAIYAHEIAHLEFYDRHRLQRMRNGNWLVVVLAIGVTLLMMIRSPTYADVFSVLFIPVLAASLLLRMAKKKQHESDSDRRAVELCGDAEALARALTKLHEYNLYPRRWDPEFERRATHPSLAHRIQAIRSAAKQPPPLPPSPIVIGDGLGKDSLIVLASDRLHRMTGVPPGTPRELPQLMQCAAATESIQYSALTELRVRTAGSHRALLVASDSTGRSWKTPLKPDEIAPVQKMLDQIDFHLAPPSRKSWLAEPLAPVLILAIFLLSTVSNNVTLALIVAAACAFIGRSRSALAATGVIAAAGVFGSEVPVEALAQIGVVAAGLLGIVSFGVALRWKQAGRPSRWSVVLVAALGLLTALATAGLVMAARSSIVGLHDAASGNRTPFLASLGLGVALLFFPQRIAKAGGIAAVLAGVTIAACGSTVFLDTFARDPLLQPNAVQILIERAVRATPLRRAVVDAYAYDLRISPGGDRFAVRSYETRRGPVEFIVGDFEGHKESVQAQDLRFASEDRALALVRASGGVALVAVQAPGWQPGGWRRDLPDLLAGNLWVDPDSIAWEVAGWKSDSDRLVLLRGKIDGDDVMEKSFCPRPGDEGETEWHASDGDVALGVDLDYDLPSFPWWMYFNTSPFPMRHQLWRLGISRAEAFLTTDLQVSCLTWRSTDGPFLCTSSDRERTWFWRIDPTSGGRECLAVTESVFVDAVEIPGGGIAALTAEGVLCQVDLPARRMTRAAIDLRRTLSLAAAEGGQIAVLGYRGDAPAVELYKLEASK